MGGIKALFLALTQDCLLSGTSDCNCYDCVTIISRPPVSCPGYGISTSWKSADISEGKCIISMHRLSINTPILNKPVIC